MAVRKKNILLVEDHDLVALCQMRQLKSLGFNVRRVSNGESAVKEMTDSGPDIELVLMDINLGPNMDGITAAKCILALADVPIIFLSSYREEEVCGPGEKLPSCAYVPKSAGISVLAATIKAALDAPAHSWETEAM